MDSHLQTPMYFFFQNFSFSEVSSTVVCIPRFLGAIITKDKTISYNCAAQLFFSIFMGVTEFYILTAIVICCHLQAPALHNHHEQETLPPACALCMAGRVSDHFLTPYASPPAGLVCFQCHWSLFVWLFPPFTIVLFRYMASRSNGFLLCFG